MNFVRKLREDDLHCAFDGQDQTSVKNSKFFGRTLVGLECTVKAKLRLMNVSINLCGVASVKRDLLSCFLLDLL